MLCHSAATRGQCAQPERRDELGGLSRVGGDSDLGFGGGGFVSFARFEPGVEPYRFRVEIAGAITFKPAEGGVDVPYQDL